MLRWIDGQPTANVVRPQINQMNPLIAAGNATQEGDLLLGLTQRVNPVTSSAMRISSPAYVARCGGAMRQPWRSGC